MGSDGAIFDCPEVVWSPLTCKSGSGEKWPCTNQGALRGAWVLYTTCKYIDWNRSTCAGQRAFLDCPCVSSYEKTPCRHVCYILLLHTFPSLCIVNMYFTGIYWFYPPLSQEFRNIFHTWSYDRVTVGMVVDCMTILLFFIMPFSDSITDSSLRICVATGWCLLLRFGHVFLDWHCSPLQCCEQSLSGKL